MTLTSPAGAQVDIDTSSSFVYPEYSKRISMDFEEASLADVLKIFSQQTKMNLITSEDLGDRKVTVYLDDVPVEQALQRLLKANNLTYEVQPGSNIYIVKPLPQEAPQLVTRIYQLQHASVSSSKIGKTLNITTDESGQGNGGSAQSNINNTGNKEDTGIKAAIEAILTKDGKVVEDDRTNSLVITDIAGNFPRIEQTLDRLDVAVAQILIEVEMLEVSKEDVDLLGIKWGSSPLSFTGGQKDGVFPFGGETPLAKDPGGVTYSDSRFRVSTLSASGLTAALQFLRTRTDSKNLARPRILTLNNQTAQIKIATDEAIGSQTQTNSAQNIATSSVEAERVETGVILTVTPQADMMNGEITMAVVPQIIIARTGGTFNGVTFKDPEKRVSQSILRVRSGDTIVIGGLIRTDQTKILTKVPVLGDIPFFGHAFRHKNDTVTNRELIIFITPSIINGAPQFPSRLSTLPGKKLIREQDMPSERLKTIDEQLTSFENKND